MTDSDDSGMRVLLVDDRVSDLREFSHVARMSGLSVVLASSIDEAIVELQTKEFDVLICDMMMPGGDLFGEFETVGGLRTGVYFCQYVRIHFPKLKVCLLTSGEPSQYDGHFLFGLGVAILRKQQTSTLDLVKFIQNLSDSSPSVSFIDTIELKPGIFGLKVDLKKSMILLKQIRMRWMEK